MKKIIPLLALPLVALSLTACSTAAEVVEVPAEEPTVTAPEEETVTTLSYAAQDVPLTAESESATIFPHFIGSATGFTLVNGGSSSCPNEIDTVSYDEETNVFDVTYVVIEPDRACTSDFQLTATEVTVESVTVADPEAVALNLDGMTVQPLSEVPSLP